MRRTVALLLCAAAALAAGCTRFGRQGPASGQETEETAFPVQVVAAGFADIVETVSVTGTIRAQREADISAQISAEVLEVRVREGDSVRQGQVLITLDSTHAASQADQARAGVEAARARYEAAQKRLEIIEQGARQEEISIARSQLERAESALRTAEADLHRLRGLFEQGAISKQQLDGAQMAYDSARTARDSARDALELTQKGARPEEIEAARKEVEASDAALTQARGALAAAAEMLTYTTIRSPIAGVVYSRHIEPGEIAAPGGTLPLLQLADPSSIYYEARVSERKAHQVTPGQRVDVTLQANGERVLAGRVERLVPVADPGSRDFLVRISLPDSAEVTSPGVFARGAVVVTERPQALVIPKDALGDREGRDIVFVVRDGRAQLREVQVGLTDRARAEITSGLASGDQVVLIGMEGLQDGDPVQVREAGGR
jgi:HlyD family secretion protein